MAQSRPGNETDELAKILARDGLTILPGNQIPANTDWHVCTTHPAKGVQNFQAACCECGCPVFFADNSKPQLKKLCIPCFLAHAKTQKVESVGNEFSLIIAALVNQRN
jgi:hypothetical protein